MTIETPITVALGDGIGPEIMAATLKILEAAGASIQPEVIEVGEKIYLTGNTTGIPTAAWESLKRTRVLLKGPIKTPQGGGYKSLNVTLRKTLGLFANVRPCISYYPYVATKSPDTNLVIIRENEEDVYTGVEYRLTHDNYECIKIATRVGCERIMHYAFEYARKFNRKKVTCMTKDNIMKMTDGLFHEVFNEVAEEYSDIEHDHLIIDIGAATLATHPERFDVIVTTNLYGDIISDIAAQVAGSVGLAGTANIGAQMALFEAIHGSAPDIAGKNIANPSGIINAAVQMLIHINQPQVAMLIENAWLKTLEDGIHTGDIYSKEYSQKKVGTKEFTGAIIERLGQTPTQFKPSEYQENIPTKIECFGEFKKTESCKMLVGVDISLDNTGFCISKEELLAQPDAKNLPILSPEQFSEKLSKINSSLQLILISSRGLKVWPHLNFDCANSSQYTCRFQSAEQVSELKPITEEDIIQLMREVTYYGFHIVKTENLYTYDGRLGFTLLQGQ